METYCTALHRLYDRITGQPRDREVTAISTDDIHSILEHSTSVQATRLPSSVAPASRVSLHDDEPGEAWTTLTETYDMQNPELVTWNSDDDCSYEIQVDYYSDDRYKGQWKFQELDENAVWAALNDV